MQTMGTSDTERMKIPSKDLEQTTPTSGTTATVCSADAACGLSPLHTTLLRETSVHAEQGGGGVAAPPLATLASRATRLRVWYHSLPGLATLASRATRPRYLCSKLSKLSNGQRVTDCLRRLWPEAGEHGSPASDVGHCKAGSGSGRATADHPSPPQASTGTSTQSCRAAHASGMTCHVASKSAQTATAWDGRAMGSPNKLRKLAGEASNTVEVGHPITRDSSTDVSARSRS